MSLLKISERFHCSKELLNTIVLVKADEFVYTDVVKYGITSHLSRGCELPMDQFDTHEEAIASMAALVKTVNAHRQTPLTCVADEFWYDPQKVTLDNVRVELWAGDHPSPPDPTKHVVTATFRDPETDKDYDYCSDIMASKDADELSQRMVCEHNAKITEDQPGP